jgi:hypothetical protein
MSFIRIKEIPPRSGNLYDYEVESYRENGRVRSRVIRYLGKHDEERYRVSLQNITGNTKINRTQTRASKCDATCKYCGGKNVKKYGFYKETQQYFCNDCQRKFIQNNKDYKKKNTS